MLPCHCRFRPECTPSAVEASTEKGGRLCVIAVPNRKRRTCVVEVTFGKAADLTVRHVNRGKRRQSDTRPNPEAAADFVVERHCVSIRSSGRRDGQITESDGPAAGAAIKTCAQDGTVVPNGVIIAPVPGNLTTTIIDRAATEAT